MDKRIGVLGMAAALLVASVAAAETSPPHPHYEKSASLETPCPPAAKGHSFPQGEVREGTLISEICNGSAYEVLESAKTGPLRKGIGTADPQATLDVNGAVKIGNDPAPCTPAKAGSLRWTGKAFEGCDGAAWSPLNTRGE